VGPQQHSVGIIHAGFGLERDVDLFCEQLADAPLRHHEFELPHYPN
jgi:hypothetical protein